MAVWVGDAEAGAKAHLEMTLNSLSWASINVNQTGHMVRKYELVHTPVLVLAGLGKLKSGACGFAQEEVCHGLPVNITRLLGRRYFLMEKARDASIVGKHGCLALYAAISQTHHVQQGFLNLALAISVARAACGNSWRGRIQACYL